MTILGFARFTRARTAASLVLALATMQACGGRTEGSPSAANDGDAVPYPHGWIATFGENGSTIAFYNLSMQGAGFAGSIATTCQGNAAGELTFDARGRLFVTCYAAVPGEPAGSVNLLSSDPLDAPLVRVITGPSLGGSLLTGTAVDPAGNVYVLRNDGSAPTSGIAVFGPGSDSAPVRLITGDRTTLSYPNGLAVDGDGRIYVGSDSDAPVLVFDRGADGNVSPVAQLGAGAGFGGTEGIALDASGRVYAALNLPPSVVVFHDGAVERSIQGPATGLTDSIGRLAIDASGRIYVGTLDGTGIRVFAPGAAGDAAPEAIIPVQDGAAVAVAP